MENIKVLTRINRGKIYFDIYDEDVEVCVHKRCPVNKFLKLWIKDGDTTVINHQKGVIYGSEDGSRVECNSI